MRLNPVIPNKTPAFTGMYILKGTEDDLNNFQYCISAESRYGKDSFSRSPLQSQSSVEIRPQRQYNQTNIQRLFCTNEHGSNMDALKKFLSKHPYVAPQTDDIPIYYKKANLMNRLAKGNPDPLLDYIIDDVWHNLNEQKLYCLKNLRKLAPVNYDKINIIDAKEALKALSENRFDFVEGAIKSTAKVFR